MNVLLTAVIASLIIALNLSAEPLHEVEWSKWLSLQSVQQSPGRFQESNFTEGLIAVPNGGFLLYGSYRDRVLGGYSPAVRLNAAGQVEWLGATLPGRPQHPRRGMNALATTSGDFIVTGTFGTSGGYWISSFSSEGKLNWDTTLANQGWSKALVEADDGLIATINETPQGLTFRKFARDGKIVLLKTYRLNYTPFEWVQGLTKTATGYLVVCNRKQQESKLLALNANGDSISVVGLSFEPSVMYNTHLTWLSSGILLLAGNPEDWDGRNPQAGQLRGYNPSGLLIFDWLVPTNEYKGSRVNGVFERSDGSIYLYGRARYKDEGFYFAKVDAAGNAVWNSFVPLSDPNSSFDGQFRAVPASDGGFLIASCQYMRGSYGFNQNQTWLVKVKSNLPSDPLPVAKRGVIRSLGHLLSWPFRAVGSIF